MGRLAPGLLSMVPTADVDGRIADGGEPHTQESTMPDKIKDMPEKKLDKDTADTVKGGKTWSPKKGN